MSASQAEQRVLLVHGGVLSSSQSDQLLARVITLEHPRTGEQCKYLTATKADGKGQDMLEIQLIKPPDSSKPRKKGETKMHYGSYLLDQRVQSCGNLYVATRVDPTFLALPLLEKNSSNWSPIEQLLGQEILKCDHLALNSVCDVNDKLEDTLLYRFNEEATIKWLQLRVTRVLKALEARDALHLKAGDSSKTANNTGLSSGFQPIDAGEQCGSGAFDSAAKANRRQRQALEVVSEYLSPAMQAKLVSKYDGLDVASLFEDSKTKGGEKRKASNAWERSKEEDRNIQLSMGRPSTLNAGEMKVSRVNESLSLALALAFAPQITNSQVFCFNPFDRIQQSHRPKKRTKSALKA
ncbi:unnamed protein product [Chrysoparadoxa australica]